MELYNDYTKLHCYFNIQQIGLHNNLGSKMNKCAGFGIIVQEMGLHNN